MRDGTVWLLAGLAIVAAGPAGCGRACDGLVEQYIAMRTSARPAADRPAADLGSAGWSRRLADMDKPIGADEAKAADAKAPPAGGEKPAPEHWKTRRGPAYENDWLHNLGRDAKEILPTMWDDTKATFTDRWALAGLVAAGAVGITINATDVDNTVAGHYTRKGPQLNGFFDMVGDVGGNPGTHFAVAGAMYFASLGTKDVKAYETSKALINALAINGLTTMALKGLTRTRSPNGDPLGWPSGHTSSTFCLATVMHEAYGPWAGIPLFALASFVGYERVDARNHDFSDVLSGALIGIAIGHAVMQNHRQKVLGFEVVPWADPAKGTVGVALMKNF